MPEPIGRPVVDWCKFAKRIATFERINLSGTVFDMRADAASLKPSPKIVADPAAAKPLVPKAGLEPARLAAGDFESLFAPF